MDKDSADKDSTNKEPGEKPTRASTAAASGQTAQARQAAIAERQRRRAENDTQAQRPANAAKSVATRTVRQVEDARSVPSRGGPVKAETNRVAGPALGANAAAKPALNAGAVGPQTSQTGPASVAAPQASPALAQQSNLAPSSAPAPIATPHSNASAPQVRPAVGPAVMRYRHWGILVVFGLVVVIPQIVIILYLWLFAEDQYASRVGFTLRQEEVASAGALAGGIAQMFGASSGGSNAQVLYEFIQSPALVERVERGIGLRAHYSQNWPHDPVYSIWPDATIEDLTKFWLRMVRVSYEESSGLIAVEVRALDAPTAQAIATMIVSESQKMINQLNETARRDAMGYAMADLTQAVDRLRAAREAMTSFRATTQIVDPTADLQGRMGILTSLQQQLAQSIVDLDMLIIETDENDPRRRMLVRRIDVIRDRINEERRAFTAQDVTVAETDYPTLLARYESLTVDLEVAEATYRAAQAALDGARSRAERQTLYLATFVSPTLAEQSEYPARFTLSALGGFFLLMLWSLMALVYYSLRDRG